jgi:hypothetical protein
MNSLLSERKPRVIIASLALMLFPATLMAQVCRGGLSFEGVALQGQAGLEVESGNQSYGVSGGIGGAKWFGSGTLGVRTYDARSGSTVIVGFGGGRVFHPKSTGNAVHCLDLRGDFGTGPDATGPVRADESSSSLTLEYSVGLPMAASGALRVTPYAGIAARYASVVTQGELTSIAVKDFYEFVTLGVGLSLGGGYAVQPYMQLPLGRDGGGDPVLGMRLSLNFGSGS